MINDFTCRWSQKHVKAEYLLWRDYFLIYVEKHHVSVDNSKEHVHVDYIIFTVVQSDDCKESVVFLF